MLAILAASFWMQDARIAAFGGAVSLALLVRNTAPKQWTATGRGFGVANVITAARVALALALPCFGIGAAGAALLALILVLDGVDGVVARRRGEASSFGAMFDMESDAWTVAVAGLLTGVAGEPVLVLPGVLRYLYVIAIGNLPGSRGEAPRNVFARWAFVALMTSLVASLARMPGSHWMGVAATLLIFASFGRSFVWSFRATTAARREPLSGAGTS
jgi:phosphatidylglycerophosphate synthase